VTKDPEGVNDEVIELRRPEGEHVDQEAVPPSEGCRELINSWFRHGRLRFLRDIGRYPLAPDDPCRRVNDPASVG